MSFEKKAESMMLLFALYSTSYLLSPMLSGDVFLRGTSVALHSTALALKNLAPLRSAIGIMEYWTRSEACAHDGMSGVAALHKITE